ncbi:DUF4254 domain-containing protein [bacterium]|nr:DUF4254 domain-containing protein [bacterium]
MPPSPQTTALEALLFEKCWVDCVQWHLEDEIRRPEIDPAVGMELKHRIDRSNQKRTDLVEQLDDHFLVWLGASATADPSIPLNTESPAWAVDRLSILALKRYHMQEESIRPSAGLDHRERCAAKLQVLEEQRTDLTSSIQTLFEEVLTGRRRVKLYRQMKMYNDPKLNPVLYGQPGTA